MRHIIAVTAASSAAFSLFVVGAPEPAEAQSSIESGRSGQISRRVSVRDLDLAQPEHLMVLERRIALAAREVCNDTSTPDPTDRHMAARCAREAERNAWASLESRLTAAPVGSLDGGPLHAARATERAGVNSDGGRR